jgi:outer membrane protein TolC
MPGLLGTSRRTMPSSMGTSHTGKSVSGHNALVGAVDANSRSVVLARDLYVHGLGTYLAVIDAERTQYTAEDSLAQGDESLVADLIATYKALGGGWELPDDAVSNLS